MTEPNAALVGRDELIESVLERVDHLAISASDHEQGRITDGEYIRKMGLVTAEIIALIRTARDAEMRKALHSPETVDHAAAMRDWTGCGFTNPRDTSRWLHMDKGVKEWEREQVRTTLSAACDHIGLGDGTGGQG